MADDYRSKGVHRNRRGGKTPRTPLTRAGSPFKPKPRTVSDAIATAQKAGGAPRIPTTKEVPAGQMTAEIGRRASQQAAAAPQRKGPTAAQKMGAAAKAAQDMAAQQQAANAQFNAEHEQAIQEGRAMQQRMMRSTPGRAQEIIKNRRV